MQALKTDRYCLDIFSKSKLLSLFFCAACCRAKKVPLASLTSRRNGAENNQTSCLTLIILLSQSCWPLFLVDRLRGYMANLLPYLHANAALSLKHWSGNNWNRKQIVFYHRWCKNTGWNMFITLNGAILTNVFLGSLSRLSEFGLMLEAPPVFIFILNITCNQNTKHITNRYFTKKTNKKTFPTSSIFFQPTEEWTNWMNDWTLNCVNRFFDSLVLFVRSWTCRTNDDRT